jgi:ABC-type Fe3+-hydroxamate transport system substrate-binding protein
MSVRVVSLVPSVTETLLSWGVEPVAVTRFCEQPGYPTVGGTKNPDVAAIAELAPDLVVVDREENTLESADALRSAGVTLHVTHVTGVAAVPGCLAELARAVGAAPAPVRLPGPGGGAGRPLRAWVPIWRRPWMTVNRATYGSSILEAVGATNVFADAASAYPEVDLDEVRARAPDVVLAPSEPYPFTGKHRAALEEVAPVVFVDGKDLFWWGSRTEGAIGRLADVVAAAAGEVTSRR